MRPVGTASVKSRVMSSATTALVTSTTGDAAVTTTVSVTLPAGNVTETDAVWPARTRKSSCRLVWNPWSSTVTT